LARLKAALIDPLGRRFDIEAGVLAAAGIELTARKCTTDDDVIALAGDADAVLVVTYPITEAVLARCPKLRVIVRYGVGVDNVDIAAATARGVMVCNVPDYCIDEVANHTMAMLLALNRRLVQQGNAIRSSQRAPLAPMGRLRGETLGLIGLGRLAQAVAHRARGFGLNVIAYDPYVADGGPADAELLPLDEVLAAADYVAVHVPLTPETHGLIGARELALMKPTAYIVSTARGGIISEVALAQALDRGEIAGAGLDVWEREPVSADNPLLGYPQVIATPHTAYFSDESALAIRRRVAEIASEALLGGTPASVLNREVLAR
jgi:D-3-phosphoglycerate dehydrogenase / 2-oxoglutarate reductase